MAERQGRLLALYIVAFIVLGIATAAVGAGVFRQVLGGAIFGGLIGGVAFGFHKYKVKDKIEWILGISFFLLLLVAGWSVSITESARTQGKEFEQKGAYVQNRPYQSVDASNGKLENDGQVNTEAIVVIDWRRFAFSESTVVVNGQDFGKIGLARKSMLIRVEPGPVSVKLRAQFSWDKWDKPINFDIKPKQRVLIVCGWDKEGCAINNHYDSSQIIEEALRADSMAALARSFQSKRQ